MADKWMDDREREQRYGDWRRKQEAGDRGREDRFWEQEAAELSRRGRTFDYRDAGPDYSPRGAERAWQDRYYTGVSPAMRQHEYGAPSFSSQDYTQGGRPGPGPRGYGAAGGRAAYDRAGYGRSGYDDYPGEPAPRPSAERWEEAGRNAGDFLHRAGERVASWFNPVEDRQPDRFTAERGHRGRGPQGYKRSDERISDEIHERLTDDTWLDASNITISVSGGEATLSGTVDSREAKHRAERIVEDIGGVSHVQNNLRVARGGFFTSPQAGYGDSAVEAQMRGDEPIDPVANGTGGSGGGQSTAGKKN